MKVGQMNRDGFLLSKTSMWTNNKPLVLKLKVQLGTCQVQKKSMILTGMLGCHAAVESTPAQQNMSAFSFFKEYIQPSAELGQTCLLFKMYQYQKCCPTQARDKPRSRRSASTVKRCALLKMLQLNTSLSSHAHVPKGNPKHVQMHIHVIAWNSSVCGAPCSWGLWTTWIPMVCAIWLRRLVSGKLSVAAAADCASAFQCDEVVKVVEFSWCTVLKKSWVPMVNVFDLFFILHTSICAGEQFADGKLHPAWFLPMVKTSCPNHNCGGSCAVGCEPNRAWLLLHKQEKYDVDFSCVAQRYARCTTQSWAWSIFVLYLWMGLKKNGCMKPCLIHAWSYTCSMRMQMHDDELRFWQNAWGLGPDWGDLWRARGCGELAESHVPIIVHEDGVPHFSGGPAEKCQHLINLTCGERCRDFFVIINRTYWPRDPTATILELVNWMRTCWLVENKTMHCSNGNVQKSPMPHG